MRKNVQIPSLLVVVALSLLALTGCKSATGVTVNGKVILPPKLSLHDNDSVSLSFMPAEKTGKAAPASVSPKDLTFTATNVQPGKYKITVQFQGYPGAKDTEKRAEVFAPVNKSFDSENTKLSYEVSDTSPQSITVDLAARTVTKQ
jgi:hypothetical protein